MNSDPVETLILGSGILEPLLAKNGFVYRSLEEGKGSGGRFASGEFVRGSRRLELHLRSSLGMVTYHLASRSMSHQEYMRSVLGRPNASHYPGFSDDSLDGFRHLYQDLQEYAADFLEGSDECLVLRMTDARTFG